MHDLRLAVRMLGRQPLTSALAVVALALGIGLTTVMFSILNGAVLRGLPFAESDRLGDDIKADGIVLEDGPQGPAWRRA